MNKEFIIEKGIPFDDRFISPFCRALINLKKVTALEILQRKKCINIDLIFIQNIFVIENFGFRLMKAVCIEYGGLSKNESRKC